MGEFTKDNFGENSKFEEYTLYSELDKITRANSKFPEFDRNIAQ